MSLLALRSGGEQTHAHASSHAALFPVPLSAVLPARQPGLPNRAGWPSRHRPLPLQWSMGTYHCLGVGDVPGKRGPSSTKDWEPASYMDEPWGPTTPHTGGLHVLPPHHPQQVGSHLAAGSSLPTSRGHSTATWCPDLGKQEAAPTYTSTRRPWSCPGSKCSSHPVDRLPQTTEEQAR